MSADGIIIISTLAAYNAALIAVGIWASRRSGAIGDFLIGGRGLGAWVAGLSYAATSSSAWVLLGFSGFVYSVGVSALWMLPGVWGGYWLAWVALGKRLRRDAAARDHMTLTDFMLADSSGVGRTAIAWLASAMIVFCFIFYIAAQLQAAGGAMNSYFSMPLVHGVILSAGMIGLYSLLGGFWAVSATDTIQGLMMALVAILAPVAAVSSVGGPAEVFRVLAETSPTHLAPFGGNFGLVAIGSAIGAASIGLGTMGQPQLLIRVMAVRNDDERRKAFAISMTWSILVFSSMAMLGLAGRAMALSLDNPEQLLFASIDKLFPAFFAGLALAALLSAIMSTVDSILLSSAAAITHDLGIARVVPHRTVLVARVVMASLCVLAVWLAISAPAAIFDRVLFAWTALGAAFGPIVVARVANWKPPAAAIIASMLVGFGLTIAFNQFWPSGPGAIFERLLPWIPSLLILFLFGRPANRERADG